jgi:EAL domain-containing protein (putative c-di-GMP-specific phosphodiesterase class I)
MTRERSGELTAAWRRAVDRLVFAYQPIVEASTGRVFGYEALLRGVIEAGFPSIGNVFDSAFLDRALFPLDLSLREKAFGPPARAGFLESGKLFYNIDNRLLLMPDYAAGNTIVIAEKLDIPVGNIVFEISERHEVGRAAGSIGVIENYRRQGILIALDDYGAGYAGLKLLYDSTPDYIKIDRFFISGVSSNPRKRYFVGSIVAMAHDLGIPVIAEGVETVLERDECVELGCDYLQGYYVAMPTVDIGELSRFRERSGVAQVSTSPRQLVLIAG